ncbi:group II intron reverse transcriptase/maturase [Gracilimonas sp.]|uniref:group II intron reverse transcriptase/maturase n=1 Tax=Gracilimonas sp. TaxID=1974203 RepID=UPI0032EBCA6A
MNLFETEYLKGKTVPITESQLMSAWRKVKAARGSGGVDGKTISKVEEQLSNELYKLWNRMASGSYHPQPVKAVSIPKRDGSERWLGVPTVTDRIAQQVIKDVLEPELEKVFHPNSYGYRPNKSTHQAIAKCSKRCWERAWVVDLDIKGFFDNLDHDLLIKALERHTNQKWLIMYVKRWLKAPVKQPEINELEERSKGTPQGGVISPLLSNLFLHYAFDKWVSKQFPEVTFERYADDIIIHCVSKADAEKVLNAVKSRMNECKLEVHPLKTKIVYCKQSYRQESHPMIAFDFLGFTFQPRKVKQSNGLFRLGYGPAISAKAKKHINHTFKSLKVHRWTAQEVDQIASELAPKLQGWINYFGKYRKWSMYPVFRSLNDRLVKWLMNKYKRYRRKIKSARIRLKVMARENPNLFVHWRYGFIPG